MGVGTFQIKAPDDATSVKVYVVGDLHIGSPDCSMRQVRRVLNAITLDDAAYVAYIGDLMDVALMGSVSNVYKQKKSPGDQIKDVADLLRPHALLGKIITLMDGNHEQRLVRAAGISPTAMLAKMLDVEDRYTPTTAIIRANIGRSAYTLYATHGSGGGATIGAKANSIERLTRIVDADAYVSGHTHEPFVFWRDFVRIDPTTGAEKMTTRIFANCGSCLTYRGSYGDGRYAPASYGYPVITLYADGRQPDIQMFL